ncbi:tetratricopeptide repeat protein [Candidatus Peregrinibacteria bacterium]|nr:tetratricopeptide repeat protein [Candidatus Peregrinibacteria bacterium]
MRKLIAIISAVVLALALAGIFFLLRSRIFKEPTPSAPPLIQETPPVENLTYEEYLNKGAYYFENGFYTYAANEYVRATKLEPKRIEAYLKLMRADLELGSFDAVKSNGDTALSLDPSNVEARTLMAISLIKQNDFEEARTAFAAFSDAEANATVRYYRILLDILNDSKSGESSLKQLRGTGADSALNQKIDKLLIGYTEFNSAQAAEPVYLDELMARGFSQTGEYEMAIQKVKAVLKSRLNLRDAWIILGYSYLNLGKYTFALTAFQKAYELDSTWPTTQYFLGTTFQELNKPEDAIVYYQYAINNGFEPMALAKRDLADLYFKIQKYPEAVKLYQDAIILNQQDVNAFVRPVWLYIDFLNNPKEANKLALLALQLFPNEALSYNLLGWSEAALGNSIAAETHLKKALELNPKMAAAYFNLGKIYEGNKRVPEAIEMYQKAYQNDSGGSFGTLAAERYNILLQN